MNHLGELRRFKDTLPEVKGVNFMIVGAGSSRHGDYWFDILIDGQINNGLGRDWILRNSEVLNETG